MPELSVAEIAAIICTIGLAITAPLTAFGRFRAARDARDFIARRVEASGLRDELKVFVTLTVVELAADATLIAAFAWIVYTGVTQEPDAFLRAVLPIWRWVLGVAVLRVLIEIPLRRTLQRIRGLFALRH
ncbi:hypothetical protein [Candidatus Viadribacter manganicus]|uniref:Uncharacterized protein n=1 Tax=Candidatus Viadribacter manganicus TaxID=1759059 RepID=A0A1B1AFU6_9PROT|nr:hypothetical protein [Candidatus Viadribacter manganicus]ANP45427.1 hypothetical protein ATE48_05600 [Candidatus Viadribacter manganicus]